MERIEKIRSFINNWRQKFKTGAKTKHITSRQANRKFLNMIKGRRNVNRWRKRRRQATYYNHYPIIPSAPYISDGWYPQPVPSAPSALLATQIFSNPNMPH